MHVCQSVVYVIVAIVIVITIAIAIVIAVVQCYFLYVCLKCSGRCVWRVGV